MAGSLGSLDMAVTCKKCGLEREPTDFYPRYKTCKPCTNAKNRRYACEHKESVRAYQRIWSNENREKIREHRIANRAALSIKAKAKYQRTKEKVTVYREANFSRLLLNGART